MIDYISASESQIQLWDDGDIIASSSDAKQLGILLYACGGLADEVFASSSMDFASEEGFANDDSAKELFESAIVILNNYTSIKNAK